MNLFQLLKPKNLEQLKELYRGYGHFLPAESRATVEDILLELEKDEGARDMARVNAAIGRISQQVQSSGINNDRLQDIRQEEWREIAQKGHEEIYGGDWSDYPDYREDEDEEYFSSPDYFD